MSKPNVTGVNCPTSTYKRPAAGSKPQLDPPVQHFASPSHPPSSYADFFHLPQPEITRELGIDLCSPALQLPDLLNNIAAYEQAVGRAFLSRRSQSCSSVSLQSTVSALFDSCSLMHLSDPDESPHIAAHSFSQASSQRSSCATPHSEQIQCKFPSPTWHDASIDQSCSFSTGSTEQSCDGNDEFWDISEKLHGQDFDFLSNFQHFPAHSKEQIVDQMERSNDNHTDSEFTTDLDIAAYIGRAHSSVPVTRSDRSISPLTDCSQSQDLTCESLPDTTNFQSVVDVHALSRSPRSYSVGNSFRGWTVESDDALRAEVNAQKAAGIEPLQWSKIALRIGRRSTGVQCQARWSEVLDDRIKKGRWTADEDDSLRQGYKKHGTQWCKIAEGIGSRTQRQCRSRWLQLNGSAGNASASRDSRCDKTI